MRNHEIRKVNRGGECGSLHVDSSSCEQKRIDKGEGGFTLVELLTVTAILGLIMAIAIPSYNQFIGTVKITKAVAEIAALERDVVAYQVDKNELPLSLNDLGRGGLKDPWGRVYEYRKLPYPADGSAYQDDFTDDLNTDFDCYSYGVDGLTDLVAGSATGSDDVVRGANGAYYGIAELY